MERGAADHHAKEFVGRLKRGGDGGVRDEMLELADGLVKAMDRDPNAREVVDAIADWAKKRSTSKEARDQYKPRHKNDTELGEGEEEGVGLVIAVLYMQAAQALRGPRADEIRQKLANPGAAKDEILAKFKEKVEDGFAGQLAVNAQAEREGDADFDRKAKAAHRDVKHLVQELKKRHPKHDRDPGPPNQQWVTVAIGGVLTTVLIVEGAIVAVYK